jgi:hypothetical protein
MTDLLNDPVFGGLAAGTRYLADSGDAWDAEELTRAILTAAAPHIAAAERERIRQLALREAERIRTANFSDLDPIWAATLEDFAGLLTEGGQADGT